MPIGSSSTKVTLPRLHSGQDIEASVKIEVAEANSPAGLKAPVGKAFTGFPGRQSAGLRLVNFDQSSLAKKLILTKDGRLVYAREYFRVVGQMNRHCPTLI